MVEAVARHGYAGTTLRELVRLAGVSKTTFYEHFDSKQECFLVDLRRDHLPGHREGERRLQGRGRLRANG